MKNNNQRLRWRHGSGALRAAAACPSTAQQRQHAQRHSAAGIKSWQHAIARRKAVQKHQYQNGKSA